MSEDLFTNEPATDIGWYWVKTPLGSITMGRVQEDGRFYLVDNGPLKDIQYGPRIPTPEQCAAMARSD